MTVMVELYFGVPQSVIRDGIWAEMSPTEQSLYVSLLFESERCRTRLLARTDSQLGEMTGLSSRSLCNARKKLQERGLVLYLSGAGNIYSYTICNPKTGQPWPGNPRDPILYKKKRQVEVSACDSGLSRAIQTKSVIQDSEPKDVVREILGLPMKF
jgi:hypothetical protein